MNKEKENLKSREEILMNNFNQVGNRAKEHLKEKQFIKDEKEIDIKDVIRYRQQVELTKKDSEGKEKDRFYLYVVKWEYTNLEIQEETSFTELEFLVEEDEEGNIVNIRTLEELMKEYEVKSINDNIGAVKERTEENEKLPEEEQDGDLKKDSLEELEKEKKQEKEEKEQESKSDLTGKKPTHILQTIDVDSTYVDNWTTVSRAFDLPPEVKYITIAYPMQKDDHVLSSTMTMYMLDNRGNIIENVRGKTIRDYFEIDDATGHNPMHDDNTKLELEGDYAEKNIGQTMRRFKAKEDPDLYLSIEQKEIGGYHEVYAGGRTLDGNDPVEVQLETRNVEIQTDLEMQKIISTYAGEYNRDEIDKEADTHEPHGEKLPVAHVDGDEKTIVFKCKYIPGTDKTWEQLSKETGEGIKKLQERFVRELRSGKEPENIVEEIEYDCKMVGHQQEHGYNH